MKNIEKIKKMFFYAGLEKEEYEQIQDIYLAPNWIVLSIFSILLSIITFVFSIWTFYNESLAESRYIYLAACIITFFIAIANIYRGKQNTKLLYNLSLVFIIVTYLMGILNGTIGDKNHLSVTFIVLIIILPMIFNGRPIVMLGEMLGACVFFVIFAMKFKDSSIVYMDISDVLAFSFTSIVLNTHLDGTKARGYLSQIRAIEAKQGMEKALEKAQKANSYLEEIAVERERQLDKITSLNSQLEKEHDKLQKQYQLVEATSRETADVFILDVRNMKSTSIKINGKILPDELQTSRPYEQTWNWYVDKYVYEKDRDDLLEKTRFDYVVKELKKNNEYACRYRLLYGEELKNYQVKFNRLGEKDSDDIVLGIRCIDEIIWIEKERQAILEDARDTAEKRLNEIEALNSKLKENNDIIANSGYGIWRINMKPDGQHTMEINDTLAHIFGMEDMDLTPEELYKYYHTRLIEDVSEIERIDYVSMEAGNLMTRVLEWRHPEKGMIYLNAGGTCYIQPNGERIISGYCGDITEQRHEFIKLNKQLEEALKQAETANNAKSTFLFNMSHDIRTPMNAIVGYTELIYKYSDDRERCLNYLGKIRSSSDFLLSLINNVLEMSHIESGKMVLDETPVQTGQLGDEIVAVYSQMMKDKNIEFIYTLDVQTEYIFADKVKIKEILMNLVSNALKYTLEGGTITLARRELPSEKEGYILIETTVSDTGIGMSKEYLPRVFEEFSREQSTTENKISGTGLGMPIVKRLVDFMGGTISAESELGKGTTFVVTIPHRVATIEDIQSDNTVVVDTNRFKGKRILLAEDNELNAEIATESLRDVGFVVEHAEDGIICVDMLQKAEADYYDIILMDVQMPNMDGYKATQVIRTMDDQRKRNIPIIAVTANAFEEDKRQAFAAGMDGHIAKPIRKNELMETLDEILNQ